MSSQLQLRRGTTAAIAVATGAPGEVFVDSTKNTAVVQDGATAGGFELLRRDLNNLPAGGIGTTNLAAGAATLPKLDKTGTVGQVLTGAGSGNSPVWALPNTGLLQSISASVASNALTLTAAAGSLQFRSTSLTNGAPTTVTYGTALTLVVPAGATLGTTANVPAVLVLLVAYNGGTPVLCVANAAGLLDMSETGLITPTTISSSSTSSSLIYSASAVSANSPYRVVGYISITEATAGTWATAPTLVQPGGGAALNSLSSSQIMSWEVTGTGTNTASAALSFTPTKSGKIVVLATAGSTANAVSFVGSSSTGTTLSGGTNSASANMAQQNLLGSVTAGVPVSISLGASASAATVNIYATFIFLPG